MPSVSIAQQRLMGQAYAVKIGELKSSDIDPKYRKAIIDLSKRMTEKELKAYASTKYKGLPDHVDEDLSIITSPKIPDFYPGGPGKIMPFLDPDAKQKVKGKKNLQNLKDYRDWISGNN
jgi:hypothetical protein